VSNDLSVELQDVRIKELENSVEKLTQILDLVVKQLDLQLEHNSTVKDSISLLLESVSAISKKVM